MKFITMEHLRRFDSLAATWHDSYADKPRSALALAEKELLDQIFAASAMTGFAMRRLPEKFDEDEIFERRLLNVAEKNGSVYFFLENGELILDEPEFLEREECDSPAARTILKAFELHILADRFQVHLLLGDEIEENEKTALQKGADDVMFPRYRYLTANCASLRFVKKAA